MITYFSARFNPLIRKSGKYGGEGVFVKGDAAKPPPCPASCVLNGYGAACQKTQGV